MLSSRFWTLWWAAAISSLGDGLRYVALPLLAAALTHDPRGVAAVFLAGYLPWPLLGLASGVLVDRHDRRVLMVRANLLRGAIAAGFTTLVAHHNSSILVLAVASFVLGSAETVFANAASAILPMIVETESLDYANSRIIAVETINASLIGAPVGAALFGLGHYLPLVADTACFAASALLILRLRGSYRVNISNSDATIGADIRAGLRWLSRHQLLRSACLLLVIINATIAAGEAVLVLYAGTVLGLSNLGYTLLLVTLAIGGVTGTLLAPKLSKLASLRLTISGAAFIQAAALVVAGVTSNTAIAVFAIAAVGAASAAWNVVTVSLRQAVVPADLLGRVTSSYRTVGFAAMPIGAGAGGLIAHRFGLHAPFLLGGLLLAGYTLFSMRRLNDTPG